jgi:hypothetical protein
MNKNRTIIIIGMVMLAAFLPILKADVTTQQDHQSNTITSYVYLNDHELVITFHLPELLQREVSTERGDFTVLEIPDAGFTGAIGGPQLPALTQLYAVPTTDLSMEILASHLQETRHIDRLYPLQNPQPDCDCECEPAFAYDETAYQQNLMSPGHLTELSSSGKIRDIPFVQLRFYPVQYNPYQQTAFIYDTITVKLTFAPGIRVSVEPAYDQKPFYRLYESVFHNWVGFIDHTSIQQDTGIRDDGCDYLIITHQNFYSQAQDLAEWKHRTGYLVKVVNVSDIGSTYQEIREYLINAYDSWTPRPSYVLLIGDAAYVPTTYVNGVATDLWYAAVNGTDYYPDLFIGRITADTAADADVMIQKTLTYEQTPPMLPSFYGNLVVAAYFQDDDMNSYEDRRFVLTSEEVRDYLLTQDYAVERIYYTESYVNPTHYNNDYYAHGEPLPDELLRPTFLWDGNATGIVNAIQQGIFLLNHRDHGMETGWGEPLFTIDNFDDFSNGELLPVVFSINCLTGKFDTGECFCEEFLRKDDGGCVAIFGATDVSYSGYNDYFCRGMYDAMWPAFDPAVGENVSLRHLSEILDYGQVYMTKTWGDPWGEEEYQFELFHCFGDPSLDMYTALPKALETTTVQMIDRIQITVKDAGAPVEGAYVCLSQENGYYVSGETDVNGVVEFDKTGTAVGAPVSMMVTAHNYLYHSESFMLNQQPDTPARPSGPTEGKPDTEYLFKTSTIDIDGDNVYYNFSWGDGTFSDWVGPFNSGADGFARHSWSGEGSFNITVKARDIYGQESNWSEPLSVSMPYSFQFTHPLLQWIYSWLIHHFPLIATLLQMKGSQ